jgi:hypothetical protein
MVVSCVIRGTSSEVPLHRRYLLLILGIAATLLCLAARSKPIGYLHSWNQITTLTHISAIVDDPASWHLPYDRVTPLPYPIKTIQVAKPYVDFRVFEEFPLYHLLAAAVSYLGMSVEDAGRILSLLFWALGAIGIYNRPLRYSRSFCIAARSRWPTTEWRS